MSFRQISTDAARVIFDTLGDGTQWSWATFRPKDDVETFQVRLMLDSEVVRQPDSFTGFYAEPDLVLSLLLADLPYGAARAGATVAIDGVYYELRERIFNDQVEVRFVAIEVDG